MQKKIFLCVLVAILACMLALGVSAAGAATNEYGEVTIVEGAEGDTTVISKDAKMVVKASDGTFYTVPSYYVLTDTAEFNWKQNKALNKFLGYSETMSAKNMKSYVIRMEIPEGITATELNNAAGADTMEGAPVVEVSFPSTFRHLGAYSFKGCKSLTKVTGLENITYFGEQVFYNGASIGTGETLVIAEGTEFIGARCFQNAKFVKIVLPSTIKTVSNQAFASCKNITEIDVSKCVNIQKLGDYCFEQTAVTSFDFTPFASTLTYLGEGVLNCCYSLATVTGFEKLDGITKILAKTFYSCPLTSINLPKNITSVGDNSFRGHNSTQDVLVIPNGVTSIGEHAFTRTKQGGNVKVVLSASLTTTNGTYQFENWNVYEMYIPASFKSIPQGFVNNNKSSSIVYYYTGELNGLTVHATGNASLTKATWISAKDFTGAQSGDNIIVYGYNHCDAFYNGEHKMSDDAEMQLTSYFEPITFASVCTREECGIGAIDKSATINPIFKYLGYSCTESPIGGVHSVTQGYAIDADALAKYREINLDFTYGFVASGVANPLAPENSQLVEQGKIVVVPSSFVVHDYFAIKINGIPDIDEFKTKALIFCLYVDDNGIFYLDGGNTSESVNGITYNDILNLKKGEA